MQAHDIISLILGAVGTVTGCLGTWLSFKSRKQDLKIECISEDPLHFKVTNKSLRPIPIQSISLFLYDNGKWIPSAKSPEVEGISMPGSLPPESSFRVRFSILQVGEIVWHGRFRLVVTTQIGRKCKSKAIQISHQPPAALYRESAGGPTESEPKR